MTSVLILHLKQSCSILWFYLLSVLCHFSLTTLSFLPLSCHLLLLLFLLPSSPPPLLPPPYHSIQMLKLQRLRESCRGNGTSSCILCGHDFAHHRSRSPISLHFCHECAKVRMSTQMCLHVHGIAQYRYACTCLGSLHRHIVSLQAQEVVYIPPIAPPPCPH